MKRARTDAELSLAADEFLWESEGLTEAHHWILPTLEHWLDEIGARRVLDIGCGNGALTKAIADMGCEVTGIDASETGIELAQRTVPNAQFLRVGVDEPLPPELHGRFDAVIAVEVIEHLLLPRDLFRRAREALVPGGSLLLSTPYHGYLKNLAIALAGRFDEHWHPLRDYGHIKFFSMPLLTQLFVEEGFPVVASARVGRIPALARSMILHGRMR